MVVARKNMSIGIGRMGPVHHSGKAAFSIATVGGGLNNFGPVYFDVAFWTEAGNDKVALVIIDEIAIPISH